MSQRASLQFCQGSCYFYGGMAHCFAWQIEVERAAVVADTLFGLTYFSGKFDQSCALSVSLRV